MHKVKYVKQELHSWNPPIELNIKSANPERIVMQRISIIKWLHCHSNFSFFENYNQKVIESNDNKQILTEKSDIVPSLQKLWNQ